MLLDKKKRVIYDEEIRECIDTFESWVTGLSILEDIDYDSVVEGKALKKEYYESYSRNVPIDYNRIMMKINEEKGRLEKLTFHFTFFDYWTNEHSRGAKVNFIKQKLKTISVFGIEPEETMSGGFNIRFTFNVYDSSRIVKILTALDEIMVELIKWDIGN